MRREGPGAKYWMVVGILVIVLLLAACQPSGQENQSSIPATGMTPEVTTTKIEVTAAVSPTQIRVEPTATNKLEANSEVNGDNQEAKRLSEIPSVTVSDQPVDGGQVIVEQVVSDGPGWLVIHADNGGSPGTVLGYAAVKDGRNETVIVTVGDAEVTEILYAMLHADAGQVGAYEFPGSDAPVMQDGQMVSPAFSVITSAEDSQEQGENPGYDYDY